MRPSSIYRRSREAAPKTSGQREITRRDESAHAAAPTTPVGEITTAESGPTPCTGASRPARN